MILVKHLINSLRPSDAIWHHRSGSTWAQVMAGCLMASSHNLNQCWFLISKRSSGIHLRAISQGVPMVLFCIMSLKIIFLRLQPHFLGANELIHHSMVMPLVTKLGHHWFRLQLVICLETSHQLNLCWLIVNWIWVRSRNCGCLVTWFCYQLIAKPGNKTATVIIDSKTR